MINIEQITSRLAKLPDQQLQQYAMMHKSDPYIMALAMSESKRRKDLRASAQAGPAQEQPKVVDQMVAEMAPQQSPDESGIAALPAGDMNFADGGIVAFADGGGTYETPYDRMNRENRENAAKPPQSELESLMAARARYMAAGSDTSGIDQAIATLQAKPARMAAQNRSALNASEQNILNAGNAGSDVVYDPVTGVPLYGGAAFAAPAPMPAPSAAGAPSPQTQPTPQQIEAAVRPKPKAAAGLGGTKEAAALRGTGTPGAGGPSVASAKETAGQFLDTKGLRADLDKFYKDEEAAVAASRKRRDEGKPEGTAYSKYEEMLAKEEAGAGKEKDEAQATAIFRLGVGMMAGTSPNAFKNIGDAAGAALTEYSGAIKDMKKATKERQKALGEIEQARRAESRDDWKTAREFEEKADARMAKAREFGIKGIMDITGKDADIASGIYKTQVEQQGRMDIAQLQARTTLAAANTRAAGSESKEIAAAEAAYARDPEAAIIKKRLESPLFTNNPAKAEPDLKRLREIQASKYRQFGLTLEGAPGAASPGGTSTTGWGKAQVVNP
jgi:hypothetical protein